MIPLDDARLAEIAARADAATAGPWKVCNPPPCKHGWPTIGVPIPATGDEVDDDCHHVTDLDDCIKLADAEFIANARADVPDLLDEVRRLKAALVEMRTLHSELSKACVQHQIDRDAWKRRAEQHGCNVTDGDPDCG